MKAMLHHKPKVHLIITIAAVALNQFNHHSNYVESTLVVIVAIAAIAEVENVLSQPSWRLCGNGVAAMAAISVIGSQPYDYFSK